MKVFVLCLMVSIALAEPPISNQYLPPQQGFDTPNVGQRQTDAVFSPRPSSRYGPPSIRTSSRLPNQYLPPGNALGLNQGLSNDISGPARLPNQYVAPEQGFNSPNQGLVSTSQYRAPGNGLPSSQYRVPQVSSQLGNQRLTSQYLPPNRQNQRPSSEYGPPQVPRSQYGVPTSVGNQQLEGGYQDGGVESNNEPANYSFEYMVKDEDSGNDFGHRESRQGDSAVGVYYVLLPDGRKQMVEYVADQGGYKPRISYEDTGSSTNGGYNQNAQNYENQGSY